MRSFSARLIRRAAKPRSEAMTGRMTGGGTASSGHGGGTVPAHDHDGQLVRPSVLCIPVSPPGDDAGMREGEYALFISPGMEIEGEEPGPPAELAWAEWNE